jgi:hypothetical protein
MRLSAYEKRIELRWQGYCFVSALIYFIEPPSCQSLYMYCVLTHATVSSSFQAAGVQPGFFCTTSESCLCSDNACSNKSLPMQMSCAQ